MGYKGLKIDPPPKDNSQKPLYRVIYSIDVGAKSPHLAAEYTYRIMKDPNSIQPVLNLVDFNGVCTEIDLSEDQVNLEDNRKIAGYEAAAQYLADQGDRIFTGSMVGGLWNGRCIDACVMSKKQGDKVAYGFLIKYGDQDASNLSVDKQHQWQIIKGKAANILLRQ
jgi:hypothetical protein